MLRSGYFQRLTRSVRLRVAGVGWQASAWGRQGPSIASVRVIGRHCSGVSVVACRHRASEPAGRGWGARLPRMLQRRGPSVSCGGEVRLGLVPCSTGVWSAWRQGGSTARWRRRASPGWCVAGGLAGAVWACPCHRRTVWCRPSGGRWRRPARCPPGGLSAHRPGVVHVEGAGGGDPGVSVSAWPGLVAVLPAAVGVSW